MVLQSAGAAQHHRHAYSQAGPQGRADEGLSRRHRGAFELASLTAFAMDQALGLVAVRTLSSRQHSLKRWLQDAPLHKVAVLAISRRGSPVSLKLRGAATAHAEHAHFARIYLDSYTGATLQAYGVYNTPALLVFRSLTPSGLARSTVHRQSGSTKLDIDAILRKAMWPQTPALHQGSASHLGFHHVNGQEVRNHRSGRVGHATVASSLWKQDMTASGWPY